jgi:hypothetical protein
LADEQFLRRPADALFLGDGVKDEKLIEIHRSIK